MSLAQADTAHSWQTYQIYQSQQLKLSSSSTGHKYTLQVALPPSYYRDPTRSFPVLYLLDGYLNFDTTVGISRWLLRQKGDNALEEFIIVGVDYDYPSSFSYSEKSNFWFKSRYRDFTPVATMSDRHGKIPGEASKFYQFIKQQAFPVIEKKFRALPNKRTLAGYSLGGLFSAYALFEHSEDFDNFLIGDPSLWYAAEPTKDRVCANGINEGDKCHLSNGIIFDLEKNYAQSNRDLARKVFLSSNAESPEIMSFKVKQCVSKLKQRNFENLSLKVSIYKNENHLTGVSRSLQDGLLFIYGKNK